MDRIHIIIHTLYSKYLKYNENNFYLTQYLFFKKTVYPFCKLENRELRDAE